MNKTPLPLNLVNHEAVEGTAAAWLARKSDTIRWSEQDEAALAAWLAENTAHRVAWLRLQHAWKRVDRLTPLREQSSIEQADVPAVRPWRPRRRSVWRASIAGLACMLIMGSAALWRAASPRSDEDHYVTAIGARQSLTLNDGSKVVLNTRTRARAAVTPDSRTFWLDEGEAFFDIHPDPNHPFVVNAGGDRITVLGTKFSVRREQGRTQVIVLEGRVKLEHAAHHGGAAQPADIAPTLAKNDSAVAQEGGVLIAAKTATQTLQQLSWREGRLEFDDLSLADIATEFNRYNRRQLVVHGDAAHIKLSGRFESYNIDGLVRLMREGFGVKVQEEGDRIHLSLN